jgi:predicted transcriptional regulator of viral defense system
LATGQHGIVSSAQLEALGYTREVIAGEAGAGRLHRLHRGVYAVGHEAVSRRGLCLAAALSCGDGALLSHRSAAWLWGLTARWRPPIEVTASSPRHGRANIRLHSSKRIVAGDRTVVDGIPLTAVPRTVLDFAAVDVSYLGQALDNAERLGILDRTAIAELLRRSGGQRGVARLRIAMESHHDPAFTRSGLERRFLKLAREAGLPRPSANLFVAGYELDMYWPRERFAVELDTYDYHGDRVRFESDRVRDESLRLAGIEVTRITGKRLDREPTAVMERLALLLSNRRVLV